MRYLLVLGVLGFGLAGCTPAPAVDVSREQLWSEFGGQPIDKVLLAWGAPAKETHLTDGSRLITYQHSTIYDAQTSYQQSNGCEVSFVAKPSQFVINDIAMQGAPNECHLLAMGRVGNVIVPTAVEPAFAGPYPYPYRRIPF